MHDQTGIQESPEPTAEEYLASDAGEAAQKSGKAVTDNPFDRAAEERLHGAWTEGWYYTYYQDTNAIQGI